MKIISIFVSTLDGKITKDTLPSGAWASKEDQAYFRAIIREHSLIVMGSGTFDPAFVTAQTGILRIILTHMPENYRQYEKPGQIEFINASPRVLIDMLGQRGYETMLLVAGSKVTTDFLKQHLVDELFVTIEPKLFGNGKQILAEEIEVDLQLLSTQQLNQRGTLLLKYRIIQ